MTELDPADADVKVVITSFGYGHADPPPRADITFDAQRHFRNPHADPKMIELNGRDGAVLAHVLDTPGIKETISSLVMFVVQFLHEVANPAGRRMLVAIGCSGGRHRSVAIADVLGEVLTRMGIPASVVHRDVDKPVLGRA